MLILEDHEIEPRQSPRRRRDAWLGSLRIVLAYLLFGFLWILLSDRLLVALVPAADLPFWQSIKGLLFIAITALLLFLLVRRQLATLTRALRTSRESELRFRSMFQRTNVALIEFDDSDVQRLLQEWQQRGIQDLASAFAADPTLAPQALARLRLVAANPEAKQLLGLREPRDLQLVAGRVFADQTAKKVLAELLQAMQERRPRFSAELVLNDSNGVSRNVHLNAGFPVQELGHLALLSLVDVTELRLAETRQQLLQSLSQDVAHCPDVDAALQLALQRICEATGWQMAQVWALSPEGEAFGCTDLWFSTESTLATFHEASRRFAFMRGRGLPGRVWQSGKALWLRDITLESNFPRAPDAERAGLHLGVALPLRQDGEIHYVLEFFSRERRREDSGLLQLLTAAMLQLEWVVASKNQLQLLRRTEQHLQLTMSAGGYGLWEWQLATNRVLWSGNIERMFGLAEGGFDGRFESYMALLPTDDRALVEQAIASVLEHGAQSFTVQHRIRLGDGQLRWLEGRGWLFRAADGKPERLAGTVIDITEQQLDQRALPALAAAMALAEPNARMLAIVQQLATTLSADEVLLLDNPLAASVHIRCHWHRDRFVASETLLLSSSLQQQLASAAAWHGAEVNKQLAGDALIVRAECRDLLAVWLNPQELKHGVLLVLFRRQLQQPKPMQALLQLCAPSLLQVRAVLAASAAPATFEQNVL
ncbi:PAS domain-containing protein [Permianibacter sp. IMCC34836]|uniref:PAS domain-containing protein n=1 Tax=Permianibacter fluminis TaxID=2738515 RepID=UPI001555AD1A|nr:PAS domain-containing protein [Permianibacter fluminis]NQD38331.1 PAS domain-containing protein [Permianibacter fluminis]